MSGPAPLAVAVAALRAGDPRRAAAACRAALAARPGDPAALNLLAMALHRLGDGPGAAAAAETAVARAPRAADPWNTLGVVRRAAGRQGDAEDCFRRAARIDPAFVEAWVNLGRLLDGLGRAAEMLDAFRAAAVAAPDDPRVQGGLGRALTLLGDLDGGRTRLAAALARAPDDPALAVDLATNHAYRGDYPAAIALLRGIAGRAPGDAGFLVNLAVLHRDLEDYPAALDWIDRAIAAEPGNALAHFTRGVVLMRLGRLAEGWAEIEWRWRRPDWTTQRPDIALPAWDGGPVPGGLLVWGEQGVGDVVLYASQLADLLARVDRVALAVDRRLVPLLARSFPAIRVVDVAAIGPAAATAAAQVPIGSLGLRLRPSLAAFPPGRPYLRPDPGRTAALRRRYRALPGEGPVVGLSWTSTASRFKTTALAQWAAILAVPGVRFVSLQYGDHATEIDAVFAATGVRVHRDAAIDALADLDGFAAQVAAMDLVLTVSNTTAHFAGALGVPCRVLVPRGRGSLWYWFDGREDSPWYPPTLRLFHQRRHFDWPGTLAAAAAAVPEWLAAAQAASGGITA
ncbi:MAG: tetratricopeptide repeat protein [Alphaproteobacteria bacterium]|nr:tetratricopeptide repeat protein [Alphaproteobacteria bacterium]